MGNSGQLRWLMVNAAVMGAIAVAALWFGRWPIAFVALATLALSFVPLLVANRFEISLPLPFFVFTSLFLFASVFLGEAFDFYERLWWWDLALHGSSAVGFGLLGFLFVFMLFEGDRYAAPPIALSLIAVCVAVTIGSVWEIFEFAMDRMFSLNMQKSGLVDTMTDILINTGGGLVAGLSGYLYLIGRERLGFGPLIGRFIETNRKWFRKFRGKYRP